MCLQYSAVRKYNVNFVELEVEIIFKLDFKQKF